MKSLGTDARFRGFLWANRSSGDREEGWDGELTGQFTDIDLDQLISEAISPDSWHGGVERPFRPLSPEPPRKGTFSIAGPGLIGRSLWTPPPEADAEQDPDRSRSATSCAINDCPWPPCWMRADCGCKGVVRT